MFSIEELYLYPYIKGDGFLQMNYDLKLLEYAKKKGGFHLRFYNFSPPTLTLGRLQKEEKFLRCGFPVVKRPTGGRAVLHLGDLVYCVAVKGGWDLIAFYNLIGEIFLNSLRDLGVEAKVEYPKKRNAYFSKENCFASLSQAEISVEGKKLIGSAQYRKDGVILQHGSILLEDNFKYLKNIFPDTVNMPTSTYLYKYLAPTINKFDLIATFTKQFILALQPKYIRKAKILYA